MARPGVPSEHYAVEGSLRHLVVSRKISGGMRSEEGTDTKPTLATPLGDWWI